MYPSFSGPDLKSVMISSVRNSLKINSSGALEEIMKLIKKSFQVF